MTLVMIWQVNWLGRNKVDDFEEILSEINVDKTAVGIITSVFFKRT